MVSPVTWANPPVAISHLEDLRHPEPAISGTFQEISVDFCTPYLRSIAASALLYQFPWLKAFFICSLGRSSLSGLWFGVAICSFEGVGQTYGFSPYPQET